MRDLERSLTYSEWNARACRLANALLGLGLAKGDRIAVLSSNRLEWAEIYTAVAKAGLVAVPVNFRLTEAETAFIIRDSGAAAVLVEDALLDTVESIRTDLDLPSDRYVHLGGTATAGFRDYEDLLASSSSAEPAIAAMPTTHGA